MNPSARPHGARDLLTSYFWSGDAIRSRSVSGLVPTTTLDVPAPPERLVADWQRDIAQRLALEPGDVEPLPLARARTRWPDYRHCVHAVADWTRTLGLPEVLAASDVALMACRGARYHHDGTQYGGAAFCNLFLGEDKGLDLHFPHAEGAEGAGLRMPLVRGTAVIFDTCQPHAVIRRGSSGFEAGDFAADFDGTLVFLTWELDIEAADVARTLGLAFDVDPATASRLDEAQLRLNAKPVEPCPASGQWRGAE